MRTCLKCGKHLPVNVTIDGKRYDASRRKYCIECSPFKSRKRNAQIGGRCRICNKDNKRPKGSKVCYACINRRDEDIREDYVYGITGSACWICGYDKDTRCMDFHHVKEKNFSLTRRNIGKSALRDVQNELLKCILVCCRCHREIQD